MAVSSSPIADSRSAFCVVRKSKRFCSSSDSSIAVIDLAHALDQAAQLVRALFLVRAEQRAQMVFVNDPAQLDVAVALETCSSSEVRRSTTSWQRISSRDSAWAGRPPRPVPRAAAPRVPRAAPAVLPARHGLAVGATAPTSACQSAASSRRRTHRRAGWRRGLRPPPASPRCAPRGLSSARPRAAAPVSGGRSAALLRLRRRHLQRRQLLQRRRRPRRSAGGPPPQRERRVSPRPPLVHRGPATASTRRCSLSAVARGIGRCRELLAPRRQVHALDRAIEILLQRTAPSRRPAAPTEPRRWRATGRPPPACARSGATARSPRSASSRAITSSSSRIALLFQHGQRRFARAAGRRPSDRSLRLPT